MAEVIVALDLPDRTQALRFLDRVGSARWVKVGSILMAREGPELVRELVARGQRVFLDLKWHDIPSTVAGAVTAAADLSVAMATVHTLGGAEMLRAAARAGGTRCPLVGVSVLTSHTPESYGQAIGRPAIDLAQEVQRLAAAAVAAGLRGVVCSTREAAAARQQLGPDAWIVVPGIRRPGDAAADQARAATPDEACRAGATHLVVGRPILQASDPAGVFDELVEAAA